MNGRTNLNFSSVDSNFGKGHCNILQRLNRAVRGPPFCILIGRITGSINNTFVSHATDFRLFKQNTMKKKEAEERI